MNRQTTSNPAKFPRIRVVTSSTSRALGWVIEEAIDISNERRPGLEPEDAKAELQDLRRVVRLLPRERRAALQRLLRGGA